MKYMLYFSLGGDSIHVAHALLQTSSKALYYTSTPPWVDGLENIVFNFDINKFTMHVRTYIRQIMNAGHQPTNLNSILIFLALQEVDQD